jgi:hypothetical protein
MSDLVPLPRELYLAIPAVVMAVGCRDVHGFSTGAGHHYEGTVIAPNFVRSGVDVGTKLCLTIDTDHLQDAPGAVSTSDGRFAAAALRPIPQFWHDPLSTMQFGEGRTKNLLYAATPTQGDTTDVSVIVSLMDAGNVEVRLLRGAPLEDGGGAPLFAVFGLDRRDGACPF